VADFNPDAYLAEKAQASPAAFDPDAYLVSKKPPPGFLGTLADMGSSAIGGLASTFNPYLTNDPHNMGEGDAQYTPLPDAETPKNVPGSDYVPQSVPGQYMQTLGQFLPAALTGPEGIGAKLASVAIPAVASETAGQLTKGTGLEGSARVAAALASPGIAGLVKRTPQAIAEALGKYTPASAVDEVAPTVSDLHNAGDNLYNSVFTDPSKNFVVSKAALQTLADKVKGVATDFGYDPDYNPKVAKLITNISAIPEDNSTLMGVINQKRAAGNIAADYGTADGKLAGQIKGTISDWLAGLDHSDVVPTGTGDADLGSIDTLKQADQTWAQYKKSAAIGKVIDNANITAGVNYSQAGLDTALRRGFANLAKSKQMAYFSPDEQTAIRQVSAGGPVASIFRAVGKYAPSGPVSSAISTGLGHAIGGPIGAVALPAIGALAKAGATASTLDNVDALSALVRGGPEAQAMLQKIKAAKLAATLQNYLPAAAGTAMSLSQMDQ
jgi:hypothetical protein